MMDSSTQNQIGKPSIERFPISRGYTINLAAKKAMDAAGGVVLKAATILESMIRNDSDLRDAILEPLIKTACYTAVSAINRTERRRVWDTPKFAPGSKADRLDALAESNRLMNFPLNSGITLAEATQTDILKTAESFKKQGKTLLLQAHWLELIATRLRGRQKVKSIFTESELRNLQKEAGYV